MNSKMTVKKNGRSKKVKEVKEEEVIFPLDHVLKMTERESLTLETLDEKIRNYLQTVKNMELENKIKELEVKLKEYEIRMLGQELRIREKEQKIHELVFKEEVQKVNADIENRKVVMKQIISKHEEEYVKYKDCVKTIADTYGLEPDKLAFDFETRTLQSLSDI